MEVTVNSLIEFLQNEVEVNPEYGDRPLHVQHQENYPLILEISGVYDPQGDDAKHLFLEEPPLDVEAEDMDADEAWTEEVEGNEQRKPVYLVLGSHPYGLNPYGTREAWEAMDRI